MLVTLTHPRAKAMGPIPLPLGGGEVSKRAPRCDKNRAY